MHVKTDQRENAGPDAVEVGPVRLVHPLRKLDKRGIGVVWTPSSRLEPENPGRSAQAKVLPALAIALELDLTNSDPPQPLSLEQYAGNDIWHT